MARRAISLALKDLGCPGVQDLNSPGERAVLQAFLSEDPRRSMPAFLWETARNDLLRKLPQTLGIWEPNGVIPPGAVEISTHAKVGGGMARVQGFVVDVLGEKIAIVTQIEESWAGIVRLDQAESAILIAYYASPQPV